MGKLFKVLIILVILAAVTAGGYAYVKSSRNGESKFKLVETTTESIIEKAVAVGQVQPRQKFQVKSKISGIVERTFVEIGDSVKAGDALFEIAPIGVATSGILGMINVLAGYFPARRAAAIDPASTLRYE